MNPPLYKSPLRVREQAPSFVEYADGLTNQKVGIVYSKEGKWYLSTRYFGNWHPLEVFSKYQGFLVLNKFHKQ